MQDEKTENVGLDQTLGAIVADMTQPSAIADNPEHLQTPASSVSEPTDKPKKRGRPPKDKSATPTPARPKIVGANNYITPPPQSGQEGIEPAAEVAVFCVGAIGQTIGGVEAAMTLQEASLIKDGFTKYFQLKGIDNVPPWVILLGALAPYSLRVMTQPTSSPRMTIMAQSIKSRIKKLFKKGKDNEPQLNSGHDTVGQNTPK